MKSIAAQAAAIIRKELKTNGIRGRVTSENYSMGSSIKVRLYNPLPATYEKVKEYCSQFQYGHFDPMTDMYEISNDSSDLPQAKYVFVERDYNDEIMDQAYSYAKEYYRDMADAPESWKSHLTYDQSQLFWSVIYGKEGDFWRQFKQRLAA